MARSKAAEWAARREKLLEREWQMHEKAIAAAERGLAAYMEREKVYANLADIARMLEVASKLGRLATGMATDKTEVTGEDGGPIRVELSVALEKIYGPDSVVGLHKWEDSGLIGDLTLTIKRLNQAKSFDGELDDVVIRYEYLSDGEQMLLGRMALFFLLQRQDGALLLLDEPETHFNDVWKREMIDLIDDAILKTTTAQVMVATHTSIALSDVFSSEIVRLAKVGGAENVAFPTFGSDPGRILLHVFGSKDTIGSRAAEFLREKLRGHWTSDNRAELETLVNEIGSGWPRAKLAEILAKLDAPPGS